MIGGELILPKSTIISKQWLSDKRLLLLALIGLFPTIFMAIPFPAMGIFYAIALYFAFKADKVKKDNHLSTYKEIVAFTEGRRLDEIEEQQEIGKRPYQTVMYMLGSAAIAFIVVYLMAKLFSL